MNGATSSSTLEQFRGPEPEVDLADRSVSPGVEDAAEPAVAIVRESAPVEEAKAEEPAEPRLIEDPRAAIAARAAARRAAAHAEAENIDPDSAPIQARTPGQQDETAAAIVEQASEQPQQRQTAPIPSPKPWTIKVNRQELNLTWGQILDACEMSDEEAEDVPDAALIRIAQKNIAAQMRLDEAKTLSRPGNTPQDAQPQQDQQTFTQDQPSEDEDDLIQKIQLGDASEARRAFDELFARRQRADRQQQIAASMQHEVGDAIESFGRANPDIANDPVAADLLRTLSVRESVNELRERVGLPEHECAQLLNNPELAVRAYNGARMKGYQVRSPAELFASAGQTVRARLNMAAPVGNSATPNPAPQDRLAIKRALPQSPASSGAANLSQAQARKPAPDARNPSETIAKMRKARFQD